MESVRRDTALRTAWASLRRAGLIAPELPAIVFIAVASTAGFWWGLAVGVLVLATVTAFRAARSLPLRALPGAAAALAVTATIAGTTGVAATGLLTDIVIDLGLGGILAASLAVRRPLFGVLLRARTAHRGYFVTTALAAAILLVRGSALAAVYAAGEPVGWLLGVKIALGLPGTLAVIAAFYAARGLEDA